MKPAAASLLLMLFSLADAADPFYGNKYTILLGQEKPGKHHPGITIKTELNVAIDTTNKADGCLNSWKMTAGYIQFTQDGSLDFGQTKSYTVGAFVYLLSTRLATVIAWNCASGSPGTYLSTFGMKYGGGGYNQIIEASALKLNKWYFVGYSVDLTNKRHVAWVDDTVAVKSFSSYSPMMSGDILVGLYMTGGTPKTSQLAGLTIFEGAIDVRDIRAQIATFRQDILMTLNPTCPIFATTTTTTTTATTPGTCFITTTTTTTTATTPGTCFIKPNIMSLAISLGIYGNECQCECGSAGLYACLATMTTMTIAYWFIMIF